MRVLFFSILAKLSSVVNAIRCCLRLGPHATIDGVHGAGDNSGFRPH